MKNVLIINTHEIYPFSEGKLSATLVDRARHFLTQNGYRVDITTMQDNYDVDKEIDKHLWADVVIVQIPVNWMSWPWSFKKYMDQVYTAGMSGKLCDGDGRTRSDPNKQYGTGGLLNDTKYMLSLTFNAPANCFGDPDQVFFEGRSPDDLFLPMHLNFKFFGMTPMETFVCYDVLKNPDVENDFKRFDEHLAKLF